MTFDDAMRRYGSDRPDTRFAMELVDLTDVFRGTGFAVFKDAIAQGGAVRALVVPGKADATRKEIDGWAAIAKTQGREGPRLVRLQRLARSSLPSRSSSAPTSSRAALSTTGAKDGDLVLAVAADVPRRERIDRRRCARISGGISSSPTSRRTTPSGSTSSRCSSATPEGGWTFSHNPFCGPARRGEREAAARATDPGKARSTQYDLVVDGNELGGGSIRIHNRPMQERVFELMGISKEEAAVRFGALLDALEYGAPPEGGIATGIDRTS